MRSVTRNIFSVELISVPADYGEGANDGAYYPIGLLALGTYLRRTMPDIQVSIVDLHHKPDFQPTGDIVGISASSTLSYRNVLTLAELAKDAGAIVVLGGPHVTQLAEQVLHNRRDLVDYVVRGHGEKSLVSLLQALRTGSDLRSVPNLSWCADKGIIHNPLIKTAWKYDSFLPLDMSLLSSGLNPYWNIFRHRIDQRVDAVFVVFTHFGCGYRDMMQRQQKNGRRPVRWCSYCSLDDPVSMRNGEAIVAEVLELLTNNRITPGANILLKCYGDNVGTQHAMLRNLALTIERSNNWNKYHIGWTFYAQSSRVSPELVDLLSRVGTRNLYIGFDTADNRVQRLNGLGTSIATHRRAVRLCQASSIRVQAGFVLGCAGETQASLENTLRFAEELSSQGVLERINSAILFVIPGSSAYSLLCDREPWIRDLDVLPTEELQWQWVRHFCPQLGKNPSDGLAILRRIANRLDDLSDGPHASMGYNSDRLLANHMGGDVR